jgi:hypothetical protein
VDKGEDNALSRLKHGCASVYRRYAIVNDADLQEAVRRLTGITTGPTARPDVAPGL